MAFAPMAANANDIDRTATATHTSSTLSSGQLAGQAQDYSIANKHSVGVFLNISPTSKFRNDPEKLGRAVIAKFAKEGIESDFRYSIAKGGASSVSFFVDGQAYAGYGFGMIKEGFTKALKHAQHNKEAELIASNTVAYNND